MKKLLLRIGGRGLWYLRRLKAKRAAKAISKVELSKCLKVDRSLHDFLLEFRSREKPLFFIDGINRELPKEILTQSEEGVKDAGEICAHNFDLLGSGKTKLGEEIDWHLDFKNGERWNPRVFYTDTVIVKGNGSDIKVPWELSRFQHLPTLGKAYWLTGDEKYAQEFVDEINDWIECNPPSYGVNWTNTMEVAIRAVNWIWGYYFFKDSQEVNDEFLLKFLKSLLIHGRHIIGNLERSWRGIKSNHYLSDIVGLVYLGVMFPEFKEARKWREFGIKELVNGMKKQVYHDGVDFEGSISYHRLVAELFLSTTLLCLKNDITFPKWYMDRLERMIEFVMFYTKPDGTAPQIGDNDDGRLHILSNYGNWNRVDHRYLLSIGAVLFKRSDFKHAAGGFHEEAFWLLGEKGLKKFEMLPDCEFSLCSKVFPESGFYTMRKDNLFMMIDCAPADSKASSGHKHNSRLSFELSAYDKSFIIDPGAYIYTANKEMRNLFRSTRYHNTVVVDGEEQNRFDKDNLFGMELDAAVKVNRWIVTKEYDLLDVEHNGYKRLKDPVIHRRSIFFDKPEGYWVIKDSLACRALHQFDLYFHFAPFEVNFDNEFPLAVKTKTEGMNLAIIPLETDDLSVRIEEGQISYRYGIKMKAPIVKYSKKNSVSIVFCNIFYPYTTGINISEIIKRVQGSKILKLLS